MKVEFLLSFDEKLDESMDNIATKVVETYNDPEREGCGYEIIEADVGYLEHCIVVGSNGGTWVASECERNPGGDAYFVTGWREVK